jgi:hypothetical protein
MVRREKVRFFGYDVTHGKFEMGEDRKAEIMKMEFPKGTKKMQSFLGSALFFKNFIINYSDLTANLTEMTHKDFNWDEKTWIFDYRGDFDKLKEKIRQCVAIHFPDYTLRTDASDVACGVVLFQVYVAPQGERIHQLIAVSSKKFSRQAKRWDIHKKEAYGMFYGFKAFEYLLRGKDFIIQTDHANLAWIGANQTPIVARWRIYMQGFN